MTQQLLLAQTGLSNAGASPFAITGALGARSRLNADGSAGVAATKAETAGTQASFAHTLREKKQAARSEQPTKSKPERERSEHAEEPKARTRKAKKSEEKPEADAKRVEDADASETKDKTAEADAGVKPEAVDQARKDAAAKDVQPEAVAAPQVDPAALKPVEVVQTPLQAAGSDVKVGDEVVTEVEGAVGTEAKPDTRTHTIAAATTPAVQQTPQAQQQALAGELTGVSNNAAEQSDQAVTATVTSAKQEDQSDRTQAQPTNIAALDHAFRTKAAAASRPGGQTARPEPSSAGRAKANPEVKPAIETATEGVTPASESVPEVKGAPRQVDAAEQAAPVPVAETVAPAPSREAGQNQDAIAGQRVEASSATTLQTIDPASVPDAGVAAMGVVETRVDPVPSAQASPSADMLRALGPSHSPSNINAAPQTNAANAAATSPEFQRAMGQQVERGIALAIQQASAANNAMAAGTGAVVLRLNPAHLGQLKVQIRFEGGAGGGVRARFEASSSKAKSMLGDSIESLKTALEDRGLRVDEVVVAQSPRLPEPDLGMYTPGSGQDARSGAGDGGPGFAGQQDQAAPHTFGALAGGASRDSSAETDQDFPIGGLGEQPVMLTGAAGWTVDADGRVRVDALV